MYFYNPLAIVDFGYFEIWYTFFFFFSFYFQNWLTVWIYLSKAALPYGPNHMALEHIGKSVKGEGGKT